MGAGRAVAPFETDSESSKTCSTPSADVAAVGWSSAVVGSKRSVCAACTNNNCLSFGFCSFAADVVVVASQTLARLAFASASS